MAIPVAERTAVRPRHTAEVEGKRELRDECRDDGEEEEPVDGDVVEQSRLPPLPSLEPLEHRLVVQMEREECEIGDRGKPSDAEHGEEQRAPRALESERCDAHATGRKRAVGREIPGVRDPEGPERHAEEAEKGRERTWATALPHHRDGQRKRETGERKRHRMSVKVAVDEGERRELGDRPGLPLTRCDDTRGVPEPPVVRHLAFEPEPKDAELTEVPESGDEDRAEDREDDGLPEASSTPRRQPQGGAECRRSE